MTTSNATLSRLIPFAHYRLSVKCIPLPHLETSSFIPHGFWSRTVDIEFTTLPDGRSIVINILLIW